MIKDEKKMLEEKSWQEFRSAGLMFFINQILHFFGWALTVDIDAAGSIVGAYPSRTRFRGFEEKSIEEGHKKVAKYLRDNAGILYDEAIDE